VCVCSLCAVDIRSSVGNLVVALSVDASRRCTALCFETLEKLHVHVEPRLSLQTYLCSDSRFVDFPNVAAGVGEPLTRVSCVARSDASLLVTRS
jgi:hypothetical protein